MKCILILVLIFIAGCPSHPAQRTDAQKIESVRLFLADALEPESTSFKEVCLKHVEGFYVLINSRQLLKKSGIPDAIVAAFPEGELEGLKDRSPDSLLQILTELDTSFYAERQELIDKAVENYRFETGFLVRIKVPQLGENWTKFFENILNNYFPSLGIEDKKRMLAYILRELPASATPIEMFLLSVYASGPYFQKYLQLMADYLPESGADKRMSELKEGLQKVKSKLPSIPERHVKLYLQELSKKGTQLEDLSSLGAASVGEAFSARIKSSGKRVVVKFRRPGIEAIAARERAFFLKQAQSAQGGALRASFDQIADQIQEEFDYRIELGKIIAGIPAYEGDKEYPIQVVKPLSKKEFPHCDRYFAMELVDGNTFKDLGNSTAEQHAKSILWERVVRKFLKQGLFATENAFFHGDLHEGNLMMIPKKLPVPENATREEVQMAIDQGKIQVVLIDFGNAHFLTQEERLRLKNLFLAAAKISNSAGAFLQALLPEGYPSKLEGLLLAESFHEKNQEELPIWKIGHAMDILLAHNIEIPGFVMAFKRSLAMLCKIHETLPAPGKDGSETPKLDHVFQQAYTNSIADLLDDSSPAGDLNLFSIIQGIIAGRVTRVEFEWLFLPWAKERGWLKGCTGACLWGDNHYESTRRLLGEAIAPWLLSNTSYSLIRRVAQTIRVFL